MNRLTGWLVLAMGLGLAAGGGYAVWQGADIIQVERGWAWVIAGAAALAGGVVTIALAAVVFKLESVRRAIAAALQPSRLVAPPPRPLQEPGPALAIPAEIPVERQPVASREAHAPHHDGPVPASEPPATSHLREWGAAGVAGAVAAAAVAHAAVPHAHGEPAAVEPREEAAGWPQDGTPPSHDVAEESAPVPHADPVAEDHPVAGRHDATHVAEPEPEPPLAAAAPEREPVAVAEPVPQTGAIDTLDDSWLDRALAGTDEEPEVPAMQPLPAAAAPPPPLPFRLPPAAPPADVVARYEAGGVHYAMYDDGSIEADDGETIRRFKTMADLKAHIAGGV